MIWTADAQYLNWLVFMAIAYGAFVVSKRFTDNGHSIPLQRGTFGTEVSLRQAILGFLSHPTALCFFLLVIGFWALRFYIGNWTWFDAIAIALWVFFWPLIEWVVHVRILHARPKKIFGFNYDPLFAKIHRAHHRDPHHPHFGIVPIATLVQYFFLIPGVLFFIILWPRPITAGAVIATLAFRYELWHYLIHSSYKPKSKWFRRMRDRHLWHHFQHEGYWYGITTRAGDMLLRTNPDPKDVPLSPTVRTLGHDDTRLVSSAQDSSGGSV